MKVKGKTMQQCFELTVSLKNAEQSYKQKFLIHEECKVSPDDPGIMKCISDTLQAAKLEPEDITVRICMVVR